jgi:glycosyltransferase involved in cell wall biosynthesis
LSGCRHIRAVLALSEAQKEEIALLYRLPAESITVVGGGYNKSLFYLEKKADSPPVRLIYAGKLSNAKGVPWLLQALGDCTEGRYHLDLVGGGDGPEYEACLALAARLGTTVTLHGSIAQEQLAALIRKAHLMVLPSLFEGLPLIMLEALAAGCRVIATDLPGTREIYDRLRTSAITLIPCPPLHQVDRILPEHQPRFVADLKRALTDICGSLQGPTDSDRQSLTESLAYFSWKQVYARTERVYRQLLAE